MSIWTDERTDEVTRLWKDGRSAAEIVRMMRVPGLSRCAVIGRLWRLGLARQPQRTGGPSRSYRRSNPKPTKANAMGRPLQVEALTPTATIMDLGAFMCKWPIGDPRSDGFGFCGRRRDGGAPYCAAHQRMAVVPAPRRRLA